MSIVTLKDIKILPEVDREEVSTIIDQGIEFKFSSISGRRYRVRDGKVEVLIEPLSYIKYPGYHRPQWKESTMYKSVTELKMDMLQHMKG
jgi:hypothetical protein